MSSPSPGAPRIPMMLVVNPRTEQVSARYSPGSDIVDVSSQTIWDMTDDIEWDYFVGEYAGQVWLEELAGLWLSPEAYKGTMWFSADRDARNHPRDFAKLVATFAGPAEYAHFFLDSFSIIENGESMKRRDRTIAQSPGQQAILGLAARTPAIVDSLSPREFEVLVASTLVEAGFDSVNLRRFTKDGGYDIAAVIADGPDPETVLFEVKHTAECGLAVLDRINGVRDRENAGRAMLVASSHISRDARRAYAAHSSYVAAYTIDELFAFLADTPDWKRSPRGLWTHK